MRFSSFGGVLEEYRRINDELWELYRRGGISSSTLGRERFRRLLGYLGEDPTRARTLGAKFLAGLSRRGDLLPGCRRTLLRLAQRYRLGVVTNGYDSVQRSRLRAARLASFFDVVVTSESCGFAKPDPRILWAALDLMGVHAKAAVYVGDDLGTDARAARAASVRFCWMDRGGRVPRGESRPRFRVGSLAELADRLG